jgi:hypothetical protein
MTQKGNSERFFLADEKHVRIDGTEVVLPDVLYFEFYRASREERGVPYELTAKATKEHVKEYATAFNKFKRDFPSYKLPWGEDIDFVGVKAQEAGTVQFVEKLPELPPLEELPVETTVEVVVVEPESLPINEAQVEEVGTISAEPKSEEIVGNPNE